MNLDLYVNYLVDNYNIFEQDVYIDCTNCIADPCKILDVLHTPDESALKVTEDILSHYICYDTTDESFSRRITNASFVLDKYKETVWHLTVSDDIDTSQTEYVDSFETLTTSDLTSVLGPPDKSNPKDCTYRYEYKFKFVKGKRDYTFSIYDYLDNNGNFYEEADIYWHLAGDTKDAAVIGEFQGALMKCLKKVN
jgi:hypothetical protein